MAIYRLIAKGSFGPEEIEAMTAAYEAALVELGLADRDDPATEIVATAIVGIADKGERDPALIKERALNAIGARKFNGPPHREALWNSRSYLDEANEAVAEVRSLYPGVTKRIARSIARYERSNQLLAKSRDAVKRSRQLLDKQRLASLYGPPEDDL